MPRIPAVSGDLSSSLARAFAPRGLASRAAPAGALAGLAIGLLAACGGSVVEPTGGGGSTSGTGGSGTGTGLTSGTGTAGSTGTGIGGTTGAGGSSTGTVTGTSTGTSTGTGMGGSGPVCPAAEPMSQTPCGPVGEVCDYAADQCLCTQAGWHCAACPDAQPQAGSACVSGGPGMGGGAVCGYGDIYCRCGGGPQQGSTWHCGMCPTPSPTEGAACDVMGVVCPYADQGINCTCTGMGLWHCTLPCPPVQPQPGDPCMSGGGMGGVQQCTYGATTCVCLQGQYFCN